MSMLSFVDALMAGDAVGLWLVGLIEWSVKASVLLVSAFGLSVFLRRVSPRVRHSFWGVAVLGALAIPALSNLTPTWHLPILPQQDIAAGDRGPEFSSVAMRVGAEPADPGSLRAVWVLRVWFAGVIAAAGWWLVG